MSDVQIPEPADDLADLTDQQQVDLIVPTANGLTGADETLPQPDAEPAAPVWADQ